MLRERGTRLLCDIQGNVPISILLSQVFYAVDKLKLHICDYLPMNSLQPDVYFQFPKLISLVIDINAILQYEKS